MPLTRQPGDNAFTRWRPRSFDNEDRDRATEREAHAAAATEADSESTDADAQQAQAAGPSPEEVEATFASAREQGREHGYKEGFEQGHSEGLETGHSEGHKDGWDKGHKEATLQARRLKQLVEAMDRSLDELDTAVARELLSLATALAREMVGRSLALQPEAVADTVREALQHIPQSKVQIHLHPDDMTLVREHLKDQLEAGHHRLVADRDITRGGCRLDSVATEVDATVETRWQRVLRSIGKEGPAWHAGDDSVTKSGHANEDDAGTHTGSEDNA